MTKNIGEIVNSDYYGGKCEVIAVSDTGFQIKTSEGYEVWLNNDGSHFLAVAGRSLIN